MNLIFYFTLVRPSNHRPHLLFIRYKIFRQMQQFNSSKMAPKLQLISLLVILSVSACTASTYMVGDTSGWDISTNLESWTTDKQFNVGDVLGNLSTLNQTIFIFCLNFLFQILIWFDMFLSWSFSIFINAQCLEGRQRQLRNMQYEKCTGIK